MNSVAQRFITAAFLTLAMGVGYHYAAPYVEPTVSAWFNKTTGAAEAVLVQDYEHSTVQQNGIAASAKVRKAAEEHGVAWHVVDIHDEGPSLPEVQWALEAAKGKTLPVLCVRHGAGRAKVLELPKTVDATVEAIGKL